jgi:Undecaprenyl-phosphate glucose phosphotransferase
MSHTALNIDIAKPNESLIYKRGYSRFIHHVLVTGDLLFLNVSFLVGYAIRFSVNPLTMMPERFMTLLLVSNLAWLVNVYFFNIYAVSRVSRWESIIWNVIKALIAHVFIMGLFVYSINGYYYSRFFFALNYGVLVLAIFVWRTVFVLVIKKYRISGYNTRNVIVVGGNQASSELYDYFLSEKSHGYKLVAAFGSDNREDENYNVFFYPESHLYEYLASEKVDEIYCALPSTSVESIKSIMSYAENNLIRFRYVPDFGALLHKKVDIEFYSMVPVLSIRSEPLERIQERIVKRLFDIIFSTLVLVFLFPFVYPLVAILIKLSSKGPVLFKQMRSGRNDTLFSCYKFRTMRQNEVSDTKQATKEDDRITKIGRILRKTSMDELPQFINVWLGEMSVVGPRPHMVKQTKEYKHSIDKFMVRHFVKPGITGWAQVNGLRGATETPQIMAKRAQFDTWYIENYSFMLDLKIVVMTVYNILKGEENAF